MSTSLKVVRIAAVCCASTSRLATVRRSGDIGTTRSRAPSSTATGAGAWAEIAGGAEEEEDDSVGVGVDDVPERASAAGSLCSRSSSARTTSCAEMRPPRPVPLTSEGAMPVSAIKRRAEGGARNEPPSPATAGSGAAAAAAAAGDDVAALAVRPFPFPGAGAAAAASRAAGSISAITSPTVTVSPALRRILRRMPAPGDGTSNVAFSLSTSTSGSSTLT